MIRMAARSTALPLMVLATTLAGCGLPEVGDECAELRGEDECVDGAVCVEEENGDLVCQQEATVGEFCSNQGDVAQCLGSAICGKDSDGNPICLQVCVEQEDCPANTSCNGVEDTNVKGCRPD